MSRNFYTDKKLTEEQKADLLSEFEKYNPEIRVGRREGEKNSYLIHRALKPKHELIAALAATGMSATEIAQRVSPKIHKYHAAAHISKLLGDPRMQALVRQHVKDETEEAKGIIKTCVVKAAENVRDAVVGGDLKQSNKVLEDFANVFQHKSSSDVNINYSFGEWLAQETNKTIDVSDSECLPPKQEEEVAMGVDDFNDDELDLEGERLDIANSTSGGYDD